jgi:3'(2'), 5'-bisphosphate nucleotidase
MKNNLSLLMADTVALAKEAGDQIMEVYNRGFSVQAKSDSSPLTEADMVAHAVIDDGLELLTPEIPLLSEESANIPFAQRSRWGIYWLVDPLDGTREFVKHTAEFCVNIALIENHQPVLGVVYAPAMQLCYYAARGLGAFKQKGNLPATAINVRIPCRQRVMVVAGHTTSKGVLKRFLTKVGNYELLTMGSAIKSCLVAEGRADIYPRLGPTSEWDTAAAQCIVEEAGGFLTSMDLQPLRYNTKEELLNPHFFVYGDNKMKWDSYL